MSNNINVLVFGTNDIFPGTKALSDTSLSLDSDNTFEVSYPYVEELDFYSITILFVDDNEVVTDVVDSGNLDCSPYDCSDLRPGKTYDLTVRIPEGNL